MDADRCEGCGRRIAGGAAACRAGFEAACAFDYGGGMPYALHRLLVDTYALQHPDDYCASGKSLAAHLTGLLAWLEHGDRPPVRRALRERLDGPRQPERPEPPADRGALTLEEVTAATTPAARAEALERWARATWDAWASHHALARRWLREALETRRERCG